jgi:hypothetical protein
VPAVRLGTRTDGEAHAMTRRVVVGGLIGPGCVLATIGVLVLPWDALIGWLLLGTLLVVVGLGASYHRRAPAPAAAEPHAVPRSPPPPVADMATEDLCVAWRRSYFLLHLAVDERTRRLVVQRRQDFLDEIERRDRRGFLRWLDSGAKAGSDPAPYLTHGS